MRHPLATLHDSTPEDGQAFGRALTVSKFAAGASETDVLVAGASGEVFTFFRALPGVPDPRR